MMQKMELIDRKYGSESRNRREKRPIMRGKRTRMDLGVEKSNTTLRFVNLKEGSKKRYIGITKYIFTEPSPVATRT